MDGQTGPDDGETKAAFFHDADDPLWIAIRDFPLDDDAAQFSFSNRLARDHLWTDAYAYDVVTEYRRFLYLMARSDQTVTPSEDVDEAWHLHLSYTLSYWDGLCRAIGRPLHHDPTEGGPDERARFLVAYEYTLELYRKTYGISARKDIWPGPDQRFDPGNGYRTIRTGRFWLVRRLWSRGASNAMAEVVPFAGFFGGSAAGFALLGSEGSILGALAGYFGCAVLLEEVFGFGKPEGGSSVQVGSGCGGCGGCGG